MRALRGRDPALVARAAIGFGLLFLVAGVALAMRSVIRLVPHEPNHGTHRQRHADREEQQPDADSEPRHQRRVCPS